MGSWKEFSYQICIFILQGLNQSPNLSQLIMSFGQYKANECPQNKIDEMGLIEPPFVNFSLVLLISTWWTRLRQSPIWVN